MRFDVTSSTVTVATRTCAHTHAHAGRARAYKLINKTTAFYWNVKAEYWYSSRGLPKICMSASCMLMTDAGTHEASYRPLLSHPVVSALSLDHWRHWRLIATWKPHLSILTLALSTRSDHVVSPLLSRMEIASERLLLRPDRPKYSPTGSASQIFPCATLGSRARCSFSFILARFLIVAACA